MRILLIFFILLCSQIFSGSIVSASNHKKINPEGCGTIYHCYVPSTCIETGTTFESSEILTVKAARNEIFDDCEAILRFHLYADHYAVVSIESMNAATSSIELLDYDPRPQTDPGNEVKFSCKRMEVTAGKWENRGNYGPHENIMNNGPITSDTMPGKIKCDFSVKIAKTQKLFASNLYKLRIDNEITHDFTHILKPLQQCDPTTFIDGHNSERNSTNVYRKVNYKLGKFSCDDPSIFTMESRIGQSTEYQPVEIVKCNKAGQGLLDVKFLGKTLQIINPAMEKFEIRCVADVKYFCDEGVRSKPGKAALIHVRPIWEEGKQKESRLECPPDFPHLVVREDAKPILNAKFKCLNYDEVQSWTVEGERQIVLDKEETYYCVKEYSHEKYENMNIGDGATTRYSAVGVTITAVIGGGSIGFWIFFAAKMRKLVKEKQKQQEELEEKLLTIKYKSLGLVAVLLAMMQQLKNKLDRMKNKIYLKDIEINRLKNEIDGFRNALKRYESPLLALPDLCLIKIFNFFSREELTVLSKVNTRFFAIANDHQLDEIKFEGSHDDLTIFSSENCFDFDLRRNDILYRYMITANHEDNFTETHEIYGKDHNEWSNIVPNSMSLLENFFTFLSVLIRHRMISALTLRVPITGEFMNGLIKVLNGFSITELYFIPVIDEQNTDDGMMMLFEFMKQFMSVEIRSPWNMMSKQFIRSVAGGNMQKLCLADEHPLRGTLNHVPDERAEYFIDADESILPYLIGYNDIAMPTLRISNSFISHLAMLCLDFYGKLRDVNKREAWMQFSTERHVSVDSMIRGISPSIKYKQNGEAHIFKKRGQKMRVRVSTEEYPIKCGSIVVGLLLHIYDKQHHTD